MAKKPMDRGIPVNLNVLTEEDRVALTKQAKSAITDEMAQDAKTKFYELELARLRRAQVPADQIETITMDFAPFISFAMIDGIQFFHGYSYEVPHKQAVVLMEQMQRSWKHQDELDGRSRFQPYRRPTSAVLGPQHAGTPTRGANGVVNAEL